MKTKASDLKTLITVILFALAMAWVESAVVFYLRTLVNRIEPHQPNPLPITGSLGSVELVRELATMIMLLTVGILAGGSLRRRLGYAAVAFGVWDIAYYLYLRIMCGWPHSLLDWDILFLLPLPWWGPILAPVSIAVLMILWGVSASQRKPAPHSRRLRPLLWGAITGGVALSLYAFMADALSVADQGVEAVRNVLPTQFKWAVFSIGFALLAFAVMGSEWRLPERCDDSPGAPARDHPRREGAAA